MAMHSSMMAAGNIGWWWHVSDTDEGDDDPGPAVRVSSWSAGSSAAGRQPLSEITETSGRLHKSHDSAQTAPVPISLLTGISSGALSPISATSGAILEWESYSSAGMPHPKALLAAVSAF